MLSSQQPRAALKAESIYFSKVCFSYAAVFSQPSPTLPHTPPPFQRCVENKLLSVLWLCASCMFILYVHTFHFFTPFISHTFSTTHKSSSFTSFHYATHISFHCLVVSHAQFSVVLIKYTTSNFPTPHNQNSFIP